MQGKSLNVSTCSLPLWSLLCHHSTANSTQENASIKSNHFEISRKRLCCVGLCYTERMDDSSPRLLLYTHQRSCESWKSGQGLLSAPRCHFMLGAHQLFLQPCDKSMSKCTVSIADIAERRGINWIVSQCMPSEGIQTLLWELCHH